MRLRSCWVISGGLSRQAVEPDGTAQVLSSNAHRMLALDLGLCSFGGKTGSLIIIISFLTRHVLLRFFACLLAPWNQPRHPQPFTCSAER